MKVRLPDEEIDAEIAESVLKRAIGLSFRKEGKMLFKFSGKTGVPIDMMFMREPLFLYFMNSDKEVLNVEKAEPWYTLPEKFLHRPDENYWYLLESFEDLGIEEGDRLSF